MTPTLGHLLILILAYKTFTYVWNKNKIRYEDTLNFVGKKLDF